MKIPATLPHAALAICVSFSASVHAQTTTTGQAMQNPFFTGGNYSGWTLNAPWRDDGGGSQLIFDVGNFYVAGFYTATGAGVDLTTQPNITSLVGYDPATTRLTGFNFATSFPFTQTFAASNFEGGTYKLYFEVDVVTSGGTYRAVSNEYLNPFDGPGASLAPTFNWAGGGFLGDPAAASGGGIALNAITSVSYTAVMNVEAINTGGSTAFFALDNMSLEYQVTAIPEPSAFAALAGAGVLALGLARRRGRGVAAQG